MDENLTELAAQWLSAKDAEKRIRDKRVEIEKEIMMITGCKEEGSKTHQAGDYKITVTGKLTRKLDVPKWNDVEEKIPEALRPVTYKPTLDTKGLRYLEDNEPDVFRIIADAIETKPAKPTITIK